MVDRSELARRWAPTLDNAASAATAAPISLLAPSSSTSGIGQYRLHGDLQVATGTRAIVTDTHGKTLISAPARIEQARRMPSVKDIADKHMMWMHGRFVGADRANRNGAFWSAGDLEMAQGTVTHGPLNWLHEERHVIGSITKAEFIDPMKRAQAALAGEPLPPADPHIAATAAIWRWIWPDEAYVIEQASDAGKLWYSMECISQSVECAGENGCGQATSYADYMAGGACEHIRERSSTRRFVNPVFLGGAVIVPPVQPGWAEADAKVMNEAVSLAEAAFEQAGQPDVRASDWERLMAYIILFART